MKVKLLFFILLLGLTSCAEFKGDDGARGAGGASPQQQNVKIEMTVQKGVSSYSETLDESIFVLIPSSILIDAAHSSGSPGWISLVAGDYTFCYFTSLNTAASNRSYSLNIVRAGEDTSCTTGATTNTTYSTVVSIDKGQNIKYNVHTPRIANGTTITTSLLGYRFN